MSDDRPINPYATPASAGQPPRGFGPGPVGSPLPWEPTDAVAFGWKRMREEPMCILVFFVAMLVGNLISVIGTVVSYVLSQDADSDMRTLGMVVNIGSTLVNLPISIWIQLGLTRYTLALARRDPSAGLMQVFAGGRFFAFLGGVLLMAIALFFGFLACIVPGVILALGWLFFGFFVVDREEGPVGALKASWRATNGSKGKLFILALLMILISIAGYLACCVGILVALPVIQLAMAFAYMKLTGEEPRLA